ncbi:MAG: TauD/TfdA family dioxygenase [Pseudobacteriovorax sp.]|nr:TauD/TfdA family dioxygenase [Pseudobacteriovorax sp.]
MNCVMTTTNPFGLCIQPEQKHQLITDLDIEALRSLFRKYQLLVLRGFRRLSNNENFISFAQGWGEISLWPFGEILELVEHHRPADHIFDCSYVPMHWDGMYRPFVPEYQMFYCKKAPLQGCGGRTLFTHTPKILAGLNFVERDQWNDVKAVYKRKMEFYDSKTVSPLITKHPYHQYDVIRFNEPHDPSRGSLINPIEMRWEGVDDKLSKQMLSSIRSKLYDRDYIYAHEWQDGDLVIADNFTLLHGRESFSKNTPRHIQRIQIESDPPWKNLGLESYQ